MNNSEYLKIFLLLFSLVLLFHSILLAYFHFICIFYICIIFFKKYVAAPDIKKLAFSAAENILFERREKKSAIVVSILNASHSADGNFENKKTLYGAIISALRIESTTKWV